MCPPHHGWRNRGIPRRRVSTSTRLTAEMAMKPRPGSQGSRSWPDPPPCGPLVAWRKRRWAAPPARCPRPLSITRIRPMPPRWISTTMAGSGVDGVSAAPLQRRRGAPPPRRRRSGQPHGDDLSLQQCCMVNRHGWSGIRSLLMGMDAQTLRALEGSGRKAWTGEVNAAQSSTGSTKRDGVPVSSASPKEASITRPPASTDAAISQHQRIRQRLKGRTRMSVPLTKGDR